ncbi:MULTISPECIES: DUF6325 family protein [Amycolatopsis]|uniref:DUF1269 domain-containing family protein n=1 Tax=Amycolatopsis thermoflava TaxID=84480 RepID=A0A3N2H1A3_9PSEU|nr:DUF6325 family protein [Amycolatopsis thermoflava]ROS42637.1 hypothetical protein EDD35_5029 [Amycolatopsis thermoflava]
MSAPEATTTATGLDEMGPVDYLVIEMPADRMTGRGLDLLLDLVDRGIIRVIDLEIVSTGPDGSIARLALDDLDGEPSVELSVFAGARSGLLDDEDVEAAGGVLEPGTVGVVLLYENLWAAPLARELRRNGAQLVAGGRVPVQALLAALDAAEA